MASECSIRSSSSGLQWSIEHITPNKEVRSCSIRVTKGFSNEGINELINNLTREYFDVPNGSLKKVTVDVTFSRDLGLVIHSCSEDSVKRCWQKSSLNDTVLCSQAEWASGQTLTKFVLMDSKMFQRMSELQLTDPIKQNGIAVGLRSCGVKETSRLELELDFQKIGSTYGLTTSEVRFPNMYKHMRSHFAKRLNEKDISICLLGPGLHSIGKEEKESCPQVVELLTLFLLGKFELLDKDQGLLKSISEQAKKNGLAYDPLPLMMLAHGCTASQKPKGKQGFIRLGLELERGRGKGATFNPLILTKPPESYGEVLKSLTKRLPSNLAANKVDVQKVLNWEIDDKTVYIKPKKEQISSTLFDITKDKPSKEKYDIMVATYSLSNVFYEVASTSEETPSLDVPMKLLAPYVAALKKGGVLYIDESFREVLNSYLDPQHWEGLLANIKNTLGCDLAIHELPFSDFDPTQTGNRPYRYRLAKGSDGHYKSYQSGSASIIAIERLS